jgi:cation:H+ antiporter
MGSLVVLVLASQSALRLSYSIASFFRVTNFSRAFVIAAFVVSLPELFVGISSAVGGAPMLSLGNVLGSNVIDLSLVAGIAVIVSKHFNAKSRALKVDSIVMAVLVLLPVVLALAGGGLSRLDGFILVLSFFAYIHVLWVERKDYHKVLRLKISAGRAVAYTALMFLCIAVMFCASLLVVFFGEAVASFSAPLFVIGLVLVSLGTSIPEFSFTISSLVAGNGELSLGEIAGAVAINSSLVLGIVALIFPFAVSFASIVLPVVFLVLSLLLFVFFVECCSAGVRAGAVLVLVYIVFLVSQIYRPF